MESITEKIKICAYPEKTYPTINKFLGSLALVSIDDLKKTKEFLNSKEIVVKPSQNSVYLNGFDTIKTRVEEMESINALDAYQSNAKRINVKSAFERMNYLLSQNISLKDENGMYLECIFSKRLFEAKYGVLEEIKNDNNRETKMDESTLTTDTQIDLSVFDRVKDSLKDLDQELSSMETQPVQQANEPVEVKTEIAEENVNPIEQILAGPQKINVDDESFNKFERLYESIRHILFEVYGAEEVNESIANNLMKLVTSGMSDDLEIIYNAITYKKEISEEEKQRLLNAINEEVEYTSILDINLGMVA